MAHRMVAPLPHGSHEGRCEMFTMESLSSSISLSSPHKAELFMSMDDGDESSVFSETSLSGSSSSSMQAVSPRRLLFSSPRLIRRMSSDGFLEEFKLSTPVVPHTNSLALRRVTNMVHNSPQLQMLGCVPGKQHYSSDSSSGWESSSMETDDEAAGQTASLHDEEIDKKPSHRPENSLMSSAVKLPFRARLQQQESVLFEHVPNMTMDITFPQRNTENQQKDLNVIKRWTERKFQNHNVQASFDDQESVAKWGGSQLVLESHPEEQEPVAKWGRSQLVLESHPEEQRIKGAVEVLCRQGSEIIADGSVPYALPCFRGRKELMFITCDTLAEVLNGLYDHSLDHFEIIDCRFPYEYEGGHIIGALNMYKAENIGEIMSWGRASEESGHAVDKRMALIFHCEFSSQRGPTMMRLLRDADRKQNAHCYPYLCHPEIYLLEGGYKSFYAKYPELCDPSAYIPMVHPNHAAELKFFIRST